MLKHFDLIKTCKLIKKQSGHIYNGQCKLNLEETHGIMGLYLGKREGNVKPLYLHYTYSPMQTQIQN